MNLGSLGQAAAGPEGWTKAKDSTGGGCCVLVKAVSDQIIVLADSKNRQRPEYIAHFEPVIALTKAGWESLRRQLEDTEAPDWVEHAEVRLEARADDTLALISVADGTALTFKPDEWLTFIEAIRLGETFAPQPPSSLATPSP